MVSEFLKSVPVPRLAKVRQHFPRPLLADVDTVLRVALRQSPALATVRNGHRIAITAGSRGISNIDKITRTIAAVVRECGAEPFVIPAMGSHGGASAAGQLAVLASLGITEASVGAPLRATMDAVTLGKTADGITVKMDRFAYEADAVIVVNRVKAHTSFRGHYESGLAKMIAIGLGKQQGAEACHGAGLGCMAKNIEQIARVALAAGKIFLGVALVENAYDETCHVEVLPAEKIMSREPELLAMANANMPRLMLPPFDVLIVDEIGKNISGTGMDANIIGRFTSEGIADRHYMQRIAVLDLTAESHGNGHGMGLADVCTRRLFDKLDLEQTYPNPLTARVPLSAKIPMIMNNDLLAIQAAIKTCWGVSEPSVRLVRIKNTLQIETIEVSESLLAEVDRQPGLELIEQARSLAFNSGGNLF